jgi:hypothetical protein
LDQELLEIWADESGVLRALIANRTNGAEV